MWNITYLELPVGGLQQLFGLFAGTAGRQHELIYHNLLPESRVHCGKALNISAANTKTPSKSPCCTDTTVNYVALALPTVVLIAAHVTSYETNTRHTMYRNFSLRLRSTHPLLPTSTHLLLFDNGADQRIKTRSQTSPLHYYPQYTSQSHICICVKQR